MSLVEIIRKCKNTKGLTRKQKHKFHLFSLAKKTSKINEDGIFIECGVKYGTSSVLMAQALNCKGFLFDTWAQRHGLNKKKSLKIKKMCNESLITNNVDHLCTMIQGDVRKTLPNLLNKNPNLVIKLAHLDLDLYNPTKVSLISVWPRLTKNGAIFVHDYGEPRWGGIKKSVDEFVKKNNCNFYAYSDIFACVLLKN